MRDLGKLVCHIPARKGSKRVPAKNLRCIGGKPLLAFAIECAGKTGLFDDIYVNTDSDAIAALAASYGVKAYIRDAWLGSDDARGDDFTADFMDKIRPDTLLMINPVCPLVEPEDIRTAVEKYRASDCDTLISCEETQMQVFCGERAVNIDADAPLEPTQNNPAVKILNWAVTIWDTPTFLKSYQEKKRGYLGTRRLLFPINPSRSVKVSHESDFQLAEQLLSVKKQAIGTGEPTYWQPE